MAIIYTYGYDSDLQDNDAWVGTNSSNRKTKQFKASAIADYLNKQGKVSIGGQMNYIFKPSVPNSSGSFTSTGGIKPFDSITSLRVHVNDLSRGNVVDFMTYIVGSQLLIAQQNTPSQFGHYVINSYTATTDPDFYNLALTYIGGNGSLIDGIYYDFVALNIPDGTGSGVDTITTTDTDFISSTPSIPTAGNVTVTSSLSATGTPDNTTYLRGDNTWASIPPGLAGSGTTNYVAKWSAADTLTDSVIYDNGTNVGIGTNTPTEKLHVAGDIAITDTIGALNFIYSATPTRVARLDSDNGNLRIKADVNGTQANSFISFNIDGGEKMRITSNGNVGIGTTNPSVPLDVSGIIRTSTSFVGNSVIINHVTSATLGGRILFKNNSGSDKMAMDDSGNFGIGTTAPSELLHIEGDSNPTLRIVDTTNSVATTLYSNNFDSYLSNESSGRVFIRTGGSNGFVVNALGNVGIGTTSPSQKLHVDGNARVTGAYYDSNNLPGTSGQVLSSTATGTDWVSLSEISGVDGTGTANYIAKWSDTDTITNSVIYDDGTNVGIGTTSPTDKLDVYGNIKLVQTNNYIKFANDFVTIKRDGSNNLSFSSYGGFKFYDTLASTERLRIDSSGNVGIGTTSPQVKLETRGTASNTISSTTAVSKIVGNVGTGSVGLYSGSLAGSPNYGTWIQSMRETDNLAFQLLLNPNGGNVGIGTTSPSEKLHILGSGSGTTGRTRLQVENTNTTSAAAAIFKCGSNFASFQYSGPSYTIGEQFRVGTSADIPVAFSTNGSIPTGGTQGILFAPGGYSASPIMGVYPSSGGRVGIGTTSPSQKLHVNGSVRIADVIYDSSNSPGTAGQVLSKPTNDTIAWVNKDSITSIPTSITATPGGTLSLASNIDFVYFTWSGGSGTFDLNLPIASTHAYKIIRFVCDSTVSANDKIHVQGSGGDTVDGGLFYALNKPYNGVQVWSDGSEWIVIQAKAT